MSRHKLVLAGLLTACCLAGFTTAWAEDDHEEKIRLEEVPQIVLQAAKAAVKGFVPTEAEKETTKDGVVYEIEGRADGVEYEIKVSETGKVLKVEKEDDDDDDDDDDD